MSTAHFLGIDIGSLTVKAVLLDGDQRVLAKGVMPAGYGGQEAAEALVAKVLAEGDTRPNEVAYTVVTGYGRVRFGTADAEISEVSCHARGAFHLCPQARTVIDIGGQDSKVIRVHTQGYVTDFAMNDKCAAGTGRFLEVMAEALEVGVEELGSLSQQSRHPVTISSTCTVFAESEVIAQMSRGAPKADIVAGLHAAIASRVAGLAGQVGLEEAVVMTGGVAQNIGVVKALEKQIGLPIHLPPQPQLVGALGAALLAYEKRQTSNVKRETSNVKRQTPNVKRE